MGSDSNDSTEYSDTTQEVVDDLDTSDGPQVVADKVVFSQAQIAAVLAGGVSIAALLGYGTGSVRGQSGGKFGTESEPLDADLANYGSTSTASGYELEIEGDIFEVNE